MQQTSSKKRTPITTQTLAHAAWNFAYTMLWNNQPFNETEIQIAEQMLHDYFNATPNVATRFVHFCERVLLAYQYLQRKQDRYIPHPLKWLSPHYEHGYRGTSEWHKDLLHERTYIPVHRFELRVLSEGYLRFVMAPTSENYHMGKQAVKHYTQGDLLQAYNNIILNYQYL